MSLNWQTPSLLWLHSWFSYVLISKLYYTVHIELYHLYKVLSYYNVKINSRTGSISKWACPDHSFQGLVRSRAHPEMKVTVRMTELSIILKPIGQLWGIRIRTNIIRIQHQLNNWSCMTTKHTNVRTLYNWTIVEGTYSYWFRPIQVYRSNNLSFTCTYLQVTYNV